MLGLDIGGATLKAADASGNARSRVFSLWKTPDRLAAELHSLAEGFTFDRVALTMTAELCDCFRTKADGVEHILAAVIEAFPTRTIHVWTTFGRFASLEEAKSDPWAASASNWLALAELVASGTSMDRALLIDIGSTTTDFVPIREGTPAPIGRTDPDRLASGELVYQGVWRTSLATLISEVEIGDRIHAIAAEHFATVADVHLMLGLVAEDSGNLETADGRPATKEFALERLARMICSDRTRFTIHDASRLATAVLHSQLQTLSAAAERVVRQSLGGEVDVVMVSGQGEYLAQMLIAASPALAKATVVSLSDRMGPEVSRAACGFAVAVLCERELRLVGSGLQCSTMRSRHGVGLP